MPAMLKLLAHSRLRQHSPRPLRAMYFRYRLAPISAKVYPVGCAVYYPIRDVFRLLANRKIRFDWASKKKVINSLFTYCFCLFLYSICDITESSERPKNTTKLKFLYLFAKFTSLLLVVNINIFLLQDRNRFINILPTKGCG